MKENEYQCAVCKNIYEKENSDEWNDEIAMKELDNTFKGFEGQLDIVCDDCYKKIMV